MVCVKSVRWLPHLIWTSLWTTWHCTSRCGRASWNLGCTVRAELAAEKLHSFYRCGAGKINAKYFDWRKFWRKICKIKITFVVDIASRCSFLVLFRFIKKLREFSSGVYLEERRKMFNRQKQQKAQTIKVRLIVRWQTPSRWWALQKALIVDRRLPWYLQLSLITKKQLQRVR